MQYRGKYKEGNHLHTCEICSIKQTDKPRIQLAAFSRSAQNATACFRSIQDSSGNKDTWIITNELDRVPPAFIALTSFRR